MTENNIMRAGEFIAEGITLNDLYNGDFPDKNETFWDCVSSDELNQPLTVKTMSPQNIKFLLLGQYRQEHIDDVVDLLHDEQREILEKYMAMPDLSQKVIIICGDRVVDGNHRALAAALRGTSIQYVDLVDLEINDSSVDEGLEWRGYPCTQDCRGHQAGDYWAQRMKITRPEDCPYGGSNSFWEGCRSEAEGRVASKRKRTRKRKSI